MKKIAALLLLTAVWANAFQSDIYSPTNMKIIEDSIWVDSTATEYTKIFWTDEGAYKSVVIEARADSQAGWYQDTFAVDISVMQVFPVTNEYKTGKTSGYNKFALLMPSKAHPDSSVMHPLEYKLFDSLMINTMDTSAVYLRNAVNDTNSSGRFYNTVYGDTLKTLQTSGFGAFAYHSLVPDYSPGIAFKVTGRSSNDKRGKGTFWRFRLYQAIGQTVKTK